MDWWTLYLLVLLVAGVYALVEHIQEKQAKPESPITAEPSFPQPVPPGTIAIAGLVEKSHLVPESKIAIRNDPKTPEPVEKPIFSALTWIYEISVEDSEFLWTWLPRGAIVFKYMDYGLWEPQYYTFKMLAGYTDENSVSHAEKDSLKDILGDWEKETTQ